MLTKLFKLSFSFTENILNFYLCIDITNVLKEKFTPYIFIDNDSFQERPLLNHTSHGTEAEFISSKF